MNIDDIKNKTVINSKGKTICCNCYDKKNKLFFDISNGKGKKCELTISENEIKKGNIYIQEALF